MFKTFQITVPFFITLFLSACGGGSSSSSEVSLTDASDVVGVYMGSGSLSLRNSSNNQIVDELTTETLFNVDRNGVISFSDSSGSRGSTQLTNNLSFSFQSDARTQFDGACQSGVIFLQGSVSGDMVNAAYLSENVVCSGTDFSVAGNVSAER